MGKIIIILVIDVNTADYDSDKEVDSNEENIPNL